MSEASLEERVRAELLESSRLKEWAARHLAGAIVQAAEAIWQCYQRGGKVLFFGNGGSAADCQHLAAELVGRMRGARRPLAALALTADTSVLTALANDWGFEEVFARQVEALGRFGDLAFAISTSGRSPNVLAGLRAARSGGLGTVALLGREGGPAASLADIAIVVEAQDGARIQECHIAIGHVICGILEERLLREEK